MINFNPFAAGTVAHGLHTIAAGGASMRLRLEKRGTLVDAVETKLERAIFERRFGAGDLLPPEQRLADELGVSRGTLRLATSRLIARGLLEASQGRQTRISRLGRVVTLDALLPTVIAAREDPQALLSRACERGQSLESLSKACVTVACHARWEKDFIVFSSSFPQRG